MKIEQYIAQLSEEEIKEAYYEIVDYKRGEIFSKEGVVYKARQEIKNKNNIIIFVDVLISAFLFEMANRSYRREVSV